jgi:hypothetical protein
MIVFDFVVLGLAHCLAPDQEGSLIPVLLIEPVPSAAFLALLKGVPSAFSLVLAIDPSRMLNGELYRPEAFPLEARFPDDFHERLLAAARTFKHNPTAKRCLPIGALLSFDRKNSDRRIINPVHNVSEQDNIKQHPLSHLIL